MKKIILKLRQSGNAFNQEKENNHSIDALRYSLENENNMKYRKNRPLAYKIYTYLKENAVGYDNRIKSNELMRIFDINTNETLRTYIQEIRESDTLQKVVCSEASVIGGYWIATNEDEVYQTLQHLYKRSMKMLYNYSIIKRKCRLNNQMRMKLNKYEKEMYQSIMEVHNNE